MSSAIHIKSLELAILITLSLVSDTREYKIKNTITLGISTIGLITNLILYGLEGLIFSLAGWLIPVVLLFIFFALRMLGAGDIKLFAAVGAIMGWKFSVYSIIYSFIAGGIIALIIMLVRKNAIKRLRYFIHYIKNCLLTLSLQDYSDFKNHSAEDKFRFSYAAAPGILLQAVILLAGIGGGF